MSKSELYEQIGRGMINGTRCTLSHTQGSNKDSEVTLPGQDHSHNPFLAILRETLGNGAMLDAGWHVDLNLEPLPKWFFIRNTRSTIPSQGWKIHVSAGLCWAEEVLRRAIPVLLSEKVSFKVVSSLHWLTFLNYGFGGLSQIGKFITIYPIDDLQAVRLAVALDQVTRGLRGPAIPSDHPLSPGSLVHYRYGGFATQFAHTPNGKVVKAIRSLDGQWVPDLRSTSYQVPEGITDPFITAGVAVESEKPGPLIGGRYLLVSSLHRSAQGEISLGVDIAIPRECVLKQAYRNAVLNLQGQDAQDNLRREADVLARLAPDPRFPAVFDMVEANNDLFLVMEEVKGETLEQYVASQFGLDHLICAEQVIAWARELAAILETIHARGLVYHDLKSTNVIVTPQGKLRLIDFGLAVEQGTKTSTSGVGTRGYMSPQQATGEPAAIADDIYGLGALLYFIATRAEPALAPHPFNLLDRPLALLNPTLGEPLEKVIARCLDPDPDARYLSMASLDSALEVLEKNYSALSFSLKRESVLYDEERKAYHYRGLSRRLASTLCQAAQTMPGEQGMVWLSTHESDPGILSRNINTGSGGVVLALAELVSEFGDPRHQAVLAAGAHWLVTGSHPQGQPLPGLYVGEAGAGVALLRASQILNDNQLLDAAADRSRWVASQAYVSPDLMNGAAGRLRFHLLLWDETGEPEHRQAAIEAGEWLITVAEETANGGLCWPSSPVFGDKTYLGYAHGSAGIADALLDLFEATSYERFLTVALKASKWLEQSAIAVLDDERGLNWPGFEGEPPTRAFWCHGAAGIGKFFLHASELNIMPQAFDFAARAAHTVAYGSRWAGPTQCHGLAGNIEFLLDMFQSTRDRTYLVDAFTLASLLEAFAVEQNNCLFWPSEVPSTFTPDYMVGYSGTAVCLLRLAAFDSRPHQLSLRGFRYKPTPLRSASFPDFQVE